MVSACIFGGRNIFNQFFVHFSNFKVEGFKGLNLLGKPICTVFEMYIVLPGKVARSVGTVESMCSLLTDSRFFPYY